ncbi:MAG: leucine-rich repeat domain-containing protein [Treponema sp.]|jgi:hypothetical protein|nr:leucine-rich repeat domain-containing protein [Treponema sp.]
MAENTRAQDTLFIDMKYIVLYRKLGFKEVESDIFVAHYGKVEIRIEAEAQRFLFNGTWHPLLTYKDMVKLECIDRLLKKGYKADRISFEGKYDLMLLSDDGAIFAGFLFDEWGKRYDKLLANFAYENGGEIILYASQLSGGLIEYKSKIYTANGVFDRGFFETIAALYAEKYTKATDGNVACHNADFIINGDELTKYVGAQADVSIQQGITKIGTGAFWNNTTVEIIRIPDTVTCIAGDAFVYCDNLREVVIPKSVEVIGDNPFAGCPEIAIKNNSDCFILEDGVLFDKEKKCLIHYTPSKREDKYIVPESVEWIGKHSFYKCQNLKTVTITKNVAYMGNNAFSDCSNISLINKSPYFQYEGGVLYNGDYTQVYHYSLGSGVKDVKIKNGVRTIGRNSFWNAKGVEAITIPETVRQIGYNPFAYCVNAAFNVQSPKYATYNGVLYSSDFREVICCTAKAAAGGTLTLHSDTMSLGRNAFTGCETLRKITLPPSLKTISRGAFSGCISLEELQVPKSVEFLGDWAFNNCTALKIVKLPKGLKVEQNVFKNCSAEVIWF